MPKENPRLTPARRGLSVSYQGKTLLSAVDPVAQGERAAEAAPMRERTLYLCPSPLFGYGLSRLLERIEAEAPGSAVLCVEADRELLALSLNQGGDNSIPALCSNPRLCFMDVADKSVEQICAFVRQCWGSRSFRRVEVLRFSGAWQLYPETYAQITEALRSDIATGWGNALTLVKLGRRYIRNAIRNLALIPRSLSLPTTLFGADPLLVLGAGPSLDGFLDTLAELMPADRAERRPFRIICVDTAIPNLKDRGIRPDLIVALESQHWNLRDFVGTRNWGVPLAMDLSALPATAEILGGPCYLFFTPWTEMRFFNRLHHAGLLPTQFPPLGSVGLSAVAIALKLSQGPVITSGIDFSFTLDSYHARSTPGHREKLRVQNRFKGVLNQAASFRNIAFAGQSKAGQAVRSDPAMRNYRDLFEREFAGEERLKDIDGSGLPLGLSTLQPGEAAAILLAGRRVPYDANTAATNVKTQQVRDFLLTEREALEKLRNILRGEQSATPQEFEDLLDYCDYLWAHFPECAAAGGSRPPATDISFLKRVRTEIDLFKKLLDRSLEGCKT
jgi:hypothetical protein